MDGKSPMLMNWKSSGMKKICYAMSGAVAFCREGGTCQEGMCKADIP